MDSFCEQPRQIPTSILPHKIPDISLISEPSMILQVNKNHNNLPSKRPPVEPVSYNAWKARNKLIQSETEFRAPVPHVHFDDRKKGNSENVPPVRFEENVYLSNAVPNRHLDLSILEYTQQSKHMQNAMKVVDTCEPRNGNMVGKLGELPERENAPPYRRISKSFQNLVSETGTDKNSVQETANKNGQYNDPVFDIYNYKRSERLQSLDSNNYSDMTQPLLNTETRQPKSMNEIAIQTQESTSKQDDNLLIKTLMEQIRQKDQQIREKNEHILQQNEHILAMQKQMDALMEIQKQQLQAAAPRLNNFGKCCVTSSRYSQEPISAVMTSRLEVRMQAVAPHRGMFFKQPAGARIEEVTENEMSSSNDGNSGAVGRDILGNLNREGEAGAVGHNILGSLLDSSRTSDDTKIGTLAFDDLMVMREDSPIQESIHVNMRDYSGSSDSSSDEEDSLHEDSNAIYKKVMNHQRNNKEKVMIKVKEATAKRLQAYGVNVPASENQFRPCDFPEHLGHATPGETNFSMQQRIMKYFPDEELAKMACAQERNIPKQGFEANLIRRKPEFSIATMQYMQKYNLLTPDSPPQAARLPRKILDITALKQQPKLL